jgi:hypothetical protein
MPGLPSNPKSKPSPPHGVRGNDPGKPGILRRKAWALVAGGLAASGSLGLFGASSTIPGDFAVATNRADATSRGFVWSVHQLEPPERESSIARAEEQLAGSLGGNLANPAARGPAVDPGIPGTGPDLPLTFQIPTVINLDIDGVPRGSMAGDRMVPGLPGLTGRTDNVAASVGAWLGLEAGVPYTVVVNSDDGFRFLLGGTTPEDQFGRQIGRFDGPRGPAESIMEFSVPATGLYAARLLWVQGGGGGSLEFFQRRGGTNVPINDLALNGIPAFRGIVGPTLAYAASVIPAPDDPSAPFDQGLRIELVDGSGSNVVDPSSIVLMLDGVLLIPTVTKTGGRTRILARQRVLFESGTTHSASLSYTAGGNYRRGWSFRVVSYPTLPPSLNSTPSRARRDSGGPSSRTLRTPGPKAPAPSRPWPASCLLAGARSRIWPTRAPSDRRSGRVRI